VQLGTADRGGRDARPATRCGRASIHQHADFDGAGLAITAWLADRAGTIPWRMSAADYRAAATHAVDPVRLAVPPPPAPWDPALSSAMVAVGAAVFEEQLRDQVLDAIAASAVICGRLHRTDGLSRVVTRRRHAGEEPAVRSSPALAAVPPHSTDRPDRALRHEAVRTVQWSVPSVAAYDDLP
jgi:Protein of unknown function C-terminus (DUF2399)